MYSIRYFSGCHFVGRSDGPKQAAVRSSKIHPQNVILQHVEDNFLPVQIGSIFLLNVRITLLVVTKVQFLVSAQLRYT